MRKKLLFLACTTLAVSTILVGCSKSDSSKENETTTVIETTAEQKSDASLTDVHNAVKEAYGENYIPSSMQFDAATLKDKFGVDAEWCEEFIAEGPMMSFNVDTFVGIKAKSDKIKEVETALNAYREALIADTMQYPVNQPKIKASKILVKDDMVFFVMLGSIPMETEELGDEAMLKAYEEQIKLGVDAIENTL